MATHTSTAKPFEAGETNARAARLPSTAVAQTPQKDAKDAAPAGAPVTPGIETPDGHVEPTGAASTAVPRAPKVKTQVKTKPAKKRR